MKRLAWVIVFLIITLAGFWAVAVPEGLVSGLVEDSLRSDGFSIRLEGYRKGLFYRFHADEAQIVRKGTGNDTAEKPLLLLRDITGRISLGSVLTFRPALFLDGSVEGGVFSGIVSLTGNKRITVKAEGVRLAVLPLLETYGITGSGLFSAEYHHEGSSGDLRFSLLGAKLRGTSPALLFIPLDRFDEVRGAAVISDSTLDIRSVSLAGRGINARLKGKAAGTRLDVMVELMTDSSFIPDPVFQSLIERYRVSPGYYLIPVKTS